MPKINRQTRLRVASDEAYESTAIRLEPIGDVEEERRFVAGVVKFWLNEEWAVLDCHEAIGEAAAEIYVQQRMNGEDDLGSIVLTLGGELLSTDFSESFIGPFEVANKLSEIFMLRMGLEVCCISDDDRTLIKRYQNSL